MRPLGGTGRKREAMMNWTRNQWLEFLTNERMSRLNAKRHRYGLAPLGRDSAAARYSAATPEIAAAVLKFLE